MEATSDVESLAYEIYGKHRAAINRINRALANKEKRAAQVAEQVFAAPLEETTRGLLKHDWHTRLPANWSLRTWTRCPLLKGKCWSSKSSMRGQSTCTWDLPS